MSAPFPIRVANKNSLALLLIFAVVASTSVATAGEPSPAGIADFMLPDGRVDVDALLNSGYSGSLNLDGQRLASRETSVITDTRQPGDEFWVATFPDPTLGGYADTAVMWRGELVVQAQGILYVWSAGSWNILCDTFNGQPLSLAVLDGDLVVGGDFTIVDGVIANRIARYDGAGWSPLGYGMNDDVEALATYGGQLVAAGDFTVAGAGYADRIALWNGLAWLPLGDGLNDGVEALAEYRGKLYAAGYFHSAGPVIANHIAAWDGSAWSSLGNGTDQSVQALAVFEGSLIVAGSFTTADLVPAQSVAAWDGANWSAMGEGLDRTVAELVVSNDELYVGLGNSSSSGSFVYRWDDPAWSSLGLTADSAALSLMVDFAGSLAVAVRSYNDNSGVMGVWDGQDWSPLIGQGVSGTVRAMTVYDGDLILAGSFQFAGGLPVNGIVRWDGTNWHPLGTGLEDVGDEWIDALVVHDGQLIAGGYFGEIGGVSATNIARWSGSGWTALGAGLGDAGNYSEYVQALISHDGELIAGGRFNNSGSTGLGSMARWDGDSWEYLGGGYSSTIYEFAEYQGELIAAGYYIEGSQHIASYDGVDWYPLGFGPDDAVTDLVVYDDELIVGGSFSNVGAVEAAGLAGWDGASWRSLGSEIWGEFGGSAVIGDMAVYEGLLYVGGDLGYVDGLSVSDIMSWDGSAWASLGSGISSHGMSTPVSALTVLRDNFLVVGGEFHRAGGRPSCRLALYSSAAVSAPGAETARPARFLDQNHPNPFNPRTQIVFAVPEAGSQISLRIYDLCGRLVRTLAEGDSPGGRHEVIWDGTDAMGRQTAAGTYLCRFQAAGVDETRKLMLVR